MPVHWLGDTGPIPYVPPPPGPSWRVGQVASMSGAPAIDPHGAEAPPQNPANPVDVYRAVVSGGSPGEPPRRQPAFLARDIMTHPPVVLPPEATLDEARRLVRDRRFRHIPITRADGHLLGILSDRDLLRGRPNPEHRRRARPPTSEPRTAADLMSTELFTATPDTPIREIAHVMVDQRIGCLPILDERLHVVGVVSTTDVLRCVMTAPPLDLWV